MLTEDVERYLALRRSLGYKLVLFDARLRSFARFAVGAGDTHVRVNRAFQWAGAGSTTDARQRRIQDVAKLARFLNAEDPAHEVPSTGYFGFRRARPTPYIYTREEIEQLLLAAARGRPNPRNPLRQEMNVMLLGLIAATGLRISEALNLRVDDQVRGGVLRIRSSKFGKSRLVPLHTTVVSALNRYLKLRRRVHGTNDYMFPASNGGSLHPNTLRNAFHRELKVAGIATNRKRRPRIHDIRHTFATRVLAQSGSDRRAVGEHFVALATYLGHVHPASTYWYMEATPDLLSDIAAAAEALVAGEFA
jgi:integrase/recombinase XerD